MTRFLRDILRQPAALASTLRFLGGAGRPRLEAAAAELRSAPHIYLTAIGSSYHAALAADAAFDRRRRPVYLREAAELSHFAELPPGSVVVIISRSGESAEVVNLLRKARQSNAIVVGLTHAAASPLGREAQIPLVVPVEFDHSISVNTYTCLAATATALATATVDSFTSELQAELLHSLEAATRTLDLWRQQIRDTTWLSAGPAYYFLGRGASLASCHETRLLWEEGVKHPATSMGTGSFRHGPQEIVSRGMRFGIWMDPDRMRDQDLAVAGELEALGASVMLIGRDLPRNAATLVLQTPIVPGGWQFLLDIIPAQLAAERLAEISGVDCDSFRICSYIVRSEHGLHGEAKVTPER